MASGTGLTERRRRFVEAFAGEAKGSATEAARIAGYAQPHSQGPRLLKNVGVLAALEERRASCPLVLSRHDLQAWWSKVARDPTMPIGARLRASELLARSCGDFLPQNAVPDEPPARVVLYIPDDGSGPPDPTRPTE